MRKRNKTFKFLKRIVIFCISFIVIFTIASMILNFITGMEINPTLTGCVYAFFGTELCAAALIQILDKWREKNNNE